MILKYKLHLPTNATKAEIIREALIQLHPMNVSSKVYVKEEITRQLIEYGSQTPTTDTLPVTIVINSLRKFTP